MLRLKQQVRLKWETFVVFGKGDLHSVNIQNPDSDEKTTIPIMSKPFMKPEYRDGMYINPLICGLHKPVPEEYDDLGNNLFYHIEENGIKYYVLTSHKFSQTGVYYLDESAHPIVSRTPMDKRIITKIRDDHSHIRKLRRRVADYKEDTIPNITKLLWTRFKASDINGTVVRIVCTKSGKYLEHTDNPEDLIVLTHGNEDEISLRAKFLINYE